MDAIQRWYFWDDGHGPSEATKDDIPDELWCRAKDVEELERVVVQQSRKHDGIRQGMQNRIDGLQAQLEELRARVNLDVVHMELNYAHSHRSPATILNAILSDCPDAECSKCAKIICPHHDEMHFHHDGCPSCAADTERRMGEIKGFLS